VKQPWALHLVRGIKDCENRSWRIESGWIAVASSKEAIPLADDDKFQTSVRLSKRPCYKNAILERFRIQKESPG